MDSHSLQTQLPEHSNFTTEGTVDVDGSGLQDGDSIKFFILPVLLTFIILGFIGNTIILHAVCSVRQFNRAENLMLANLSATSIVTMISTMALYFEMTYPLDFYGPVVCKFLPGIHGFMVPAAGFTMMCISLERTERVRFPLRRATKVSAIKKICIVWALALLVDLPQGLFFIYDPDIGRLFKCRNTKEMFGSWIPYVIYATTRYSVTHLLPSFWLVHDWIRLVSQLQFLIACQTLPLHCEYRKRQKKLIGHAIIFTSVFIVVKVPVGTHFFLYQLPSELLSESVIGWVKSWKQFFFRVGMLHGCFYPLTIFCLSRDIRKYLFCCQYDRPRHRHPVPRY